MIKSYVGSHDINIYTGCQFDSKIRKYRGGKLVAVIPYSGHMLSAKLYPAETEIMYFENKKIIVKSPQRFVDVDPLPLDDNTDYYIVSALYVAACKSLGKDTTKLLTIGDTVVDENNNVIGCMNFNKN